MIPLSGFESANATEILSWAIGAYGEARQDLAPDGFVFVGGALWAARTSGEPIQAGTPVKVVGRTGLRLEVVPRETATVEPNGKAQKEN